MRRKFIHIFSLGTENELYPGAPLENETQHIFDLRHGIPDPRTTDSLKTLGTEEEMKIHILEGEGRIWINEMLEYVMSLIQDWMIRSTDRRLKIYFTSLRGHQRSVVIAEHVAKLISSSESPHSQISVKHLNLNI
jgi:RNase adaptor protein for sRNA GlmZ degradation